MKSWVSGGDQQILNNYCEDSVSERRHDGASSSSTTYFLSGISAKDLGKVLSSSMRLIVLKRYSISHFESQELRELSKYEKNLDYDISRKSYLR